MRVSSAEVGLLGFEGAASQDPYITNYVGPFGRTSALHEVGVGGLGECASCTPGRDPTGVPGYIPRSLLDRPYKRDISGLPLAKMVGYHMGIKGLEQAKPTDAPNIIMVRATNLSSLVAATLINMKPNERLPALEQGGGIAWANRVMKFAGKVPGAVGVSDAIRFSLGMHFMIGVMQAEKKEDTEESRAYLAFAGVFKDIEQEQKNNVKLDDLQGLDGLGNVFKRLGSAIGGAFTKAADKVVKAAKTVGEGISKVADFVGDLLCKGFKKVFGNDVGGTICWIIDKGIQIIANTLRSIVEAIGALVEAFAGFLKGLAAGNPMQGVKALMVGVTQLIFILTMPISTTFFGQTVDQLRDLGKRVADKNPFFPLSLILAIVGMFPPSINGAAVLILAISPALAVILGESLAKLLKWTRNKAEAAIEKFIKLALVIFQGFMALSDILPRLKTQIAAYLEKKGGVGGALKSAAGDVIDKFKAKWESIKKAFTDGKFKDASQAISALFSIVPDMFGGMLEDTNAEVPAFSETVKAIKDAPGTVDRQEKMLKQANTEVLKSMGIEERRAVVMDNAAQLQAREAGVLTARLLRDQYIKQTDTAKKEAYKQALEAEIRK